jgi:hypothetical protein
MAVFAVGHRDRFAGFGGGYVEPTLSAGAGMLTNRRLARHALAKAY